MEGCLDTSVLTHHAGSYPALSIQLTCRISKLNHLIPDQFKYTSKVARALAGYQWLMTADAMQFLEARMRKLIEATFRTTQSTPNHRQNKPRRTYCQET